MRAISLFSLEAGTSSFWWRARIELRIRVRKSATGSVRFIHSPSSPVRSRVSLVENQRGCLFRVEHPDFCITSDRPDEVSGVSTGPGAVCGIELFYQLDFTTPGISPLRASERKQRRQTPNLRRNARGRPQSWQRLCWRDLNFGFFASLTRFAVVAMFLLSIFAAILFGFSLLRFCL